MEAMLFACALHQLPSSTHSCCALALWFKHVQQLSSQVVYVPRLILVMHAYKHEQHNARVVLVRRLMLVHEACKSSCTLFSAAHKQQTPGKASKWGVQLVANLLCLFVPSVYNGNSCTIGPRTGTTQPNWRRRSATSNSVYPCVRLLRLQREGHQRHAWRWRPRLHHASASATDFKHTPSCPHWRQQS